MSSTMGFQRMGRKLDLGERRQIYVPFAAARFTSRKRYGPERSRCDRIQQESHHHPLQVSCSGIIVNKKVLLRERKRHTACRVASTSYVVLSWLTPPPPRLDLTHPSPPWLDLTPPPPRLDLTHPSPPGWT